MTIITIDCGASFIKGAKIHNGKIIAQERKSAPGKMNDLLQMITQMILELAGKEKEVVLCISNEMHGFVLANEAGETVTEYISWQKEFGNEIVDGKKVLDLFCEMVEAEDILSTGMPVRAGLPSCNLLYLYRSGNMREKNMPVYFYTLGDYILKYLAQKEPFCHPTNAAATGLYDLRTGDWNSRMIKAITCEDLVFPKIGFEKISFQLKGIMCTALPAIGDQQAALLGSGLKDPGQISFNLGTGAQVSGIVNEIQAIGEYQIRPYFNNLYLKTIPHIPSGRAINVYIRFIKDVLHMVNVSVEEEELWQQLLEEEKKANECYMKCDLSFFENAITNKTVGAIENIEEYSFTVGNLMHVVLKQMADNFVSAASRLGIPNEEVSEILFSGGIARKIPQIRKCVLESYGKDIKYTVVEDETFWGLYYYGCQVLGLES